MFQRITQKIDRHQALRAEIPNMFANITKKIDRHQFLSRSEFSALATMLAKIRTALTRIDCSALRAVESRYSKLALRARCASKSFKLEIKTQIIVNSQFCYDDSGFGYFKFQN